MIKEEKEKLADREDKLVAIIPKLNSLSSDSIASQGAEVFIGFNGLKNAFLKLCDPVIEGRESYFFHKVDSDTTKIVDDFYNKFDVDKTYLNVPSRGLASRDYKKYFSKRKSHVKIKYTDLPIPSSLNIYNDKILFISWSKEPVAFLIKSEQITKTFVKLFNEVWALS